MAAEGVRQWLAAILAADVAGYSRLMADDEAATIAALRAHREVFRSRIEENAGRVVDMAGDSVLAVFDSAAGAVEAAIATQAALAERNGALPPERQMHFRVGVNLGDIREADDGTVYGDGVNVAARLEGLAPPGGVMISEDAFRQVRRNPDLAFADAGIHEVKNIADPVRAYSVTRPGAAPAPAPKRGKRPLALAAAAAVAVIAIAAGAWWLTRAPSPPPMLTAAGTPTDDPVLAAPTGPAIAVLPFDNLSGDSSQEYFADGITEDIITGLSRFRDLLVIARNSTSQYKGQAVDVRKIGQELGVGFVLEGSIRRDADAIRVSAQLLDATSGGHIWAESFDRNLTAGSVFAIQDEITEQVVAQIADPYGAITEWWKSEVRSAAPGTLVAYECVLLAYEFYRALNAELHAKTRDCLERAVESDPNYADAWGWLTSMYNEEYVDGFNPLPNSLDRARGAGLRALEIDSNNQVAHWFLAWNSYFRRDLEKFLQHADRALNINPNNATILAELSMPFAWSGDIEKARAMVHKAMRINPRFPGFYYFTLYHIHAVSGNYEKAASDAERLGLPDLFWTHAKLATAYGHLGRIQEAHTAVENLLALYPDFREKAREELESIYWPDPEYIDRYMAGLKKAGLFDEPESHMPIVAVLPFDNLSGDPEQDYFADGITEDIITRLAQYPDILVLGRNTTFQFKGQAVDIRTVAEKLGADYVVEGSIRRGGDTVRVSAQLLRGVGGTHLWAETFDRMLDPANLFAIQDEITEAIAGRIGDPYGVIAQKELQESEGSAPQQLSSYECILRFYDYVLKVSPMTHEVARNCLEEVVEAEPRYAESWAYLSEIYTDEIALGLNPVQESSMDRAIIVAKRAIELAPNSAAAQSQFGRTSLLAGQRRDALSATGKALSLAPNNADIVARAAQVYTHTGLYDMGVKMVDRLAEINPLYPPWTNWYRAKYHLVKGDNEEAVYWLERNGMAGWYWTDAFLAAAHCLAGNLDEGRAALESALTSNPAFPDTYWPELRFWLVGGDTSIEIENLNKGLAACGWDVPPDPGLQGSAK